jgi:hypothetical protein
LKRRDGLDRRSIEQYVCVISDFRMVAVNETFFVADVRRFSLADAQRAARRRGVERKSVENRRYFVVARRVGNRRFAFFPRLEIAPQNKSRKRKSAKETENAADSTVDATTTRLPLV